MKRPNSKSALVSSALYLGFVVFTVINGLTCGDWLCPSVILLATFPWFYLWLPVVKFSYPLQIFWLFFFGIGSIVLNTLIMYQAGKAIEKLFSSKPLR